MAVSTNLHKSGVVLHCVSALAIFVTGQRQRFTQPDSAGGHVGLREHPFRYAKLHRDLQFAMLLLHRFTVGLARGAAPQ